MSQHETRVCSCCGRQRHPCLFRNGDVCESCRPDDGQGGDDRQIDGYSVRHRVVLRNRRAARSRQRMREARAAMR